MADIGRCAPRRSAALRAEPVALSQAKPAAAIAWFALAAVLVVYLFVAAFFGTIFLFAMVEGWA